MIDAAIRFAAERGIAKDRFEFDALWNPRGPAAPPCEEGYRVTGSTIPFGRDWFPYLMRRLAERTRQFILLCENLIRGTTEQE